MELSASGLQQTIVSDESRSTIPSSTPSEIIASSIISKAIDPSAVTFVTSAVVKSTKDRDSLSIKTGMESLSQVSTLSFNWSYSKEASDSFFRSTGIQASKLFVRDLHLEHQLTSQTVPVTNHFDLALTGTISTVLNSLKGLKPSTSIAGLSDETLLSRKDVITATLDSGLARTGENLKYIKDSDSIIKSFVDQSSTSAMINLVPSVSFTPMIVSSERYPDNIHKDKFKFPQSTHKLALKIGLDTSTKTKEKDGAKSQRIEFTIISMLSTLHNVYMPTHSTMITMTTSKFSKSAGTAKGKDKLSQKEKEGNVFKDSATSKSIKSVKGAVSILLT